MKLPAQEDEWHEVNIGEAGATLLVRVKDLVGRLISPAHSLVNHNASNFISEP